MLYFDMILAVALVINIPLGFIRSPHPKFSFKWFLYIHLSIPFLLWMRLHFGVGFTVVPFEIILAIVGQLIGSRIYKDRVHKNQV